MRAVEQQMCHDKSSTTGTLRAVKGRAILQKFKQTQKWEAPEPDIFSLVTFCRWGLQHKSYSSHVSISKGPLSRGSGTHETQIPG